MSVGPERSTTETNGHNKLFNLPARRTSLRHLTLASAKPLEEGGAHAYGRLVVQDGISVHVNPIGGSGGQVAPLAVGMVIGRGGLQRLVRVEPRPSPPVAPQRVAGVGALA